jgi:hypothetical protein
MTASDLEEFVKENKGGLLFERSHPLNCKIFKRENLLTICIQKVA